MREAGERLYTPRELDGWGIISTVKQWQERKSGRLGYLAIGRKILYLQRHLDAYFALCEAEAQEDNAQNAA